MKFDLSDFIEIQNNAMLLQRQRMALKLTQKDVASKCGITLRQYQRFESNPEAIGRASFNVAMSVIKVLGLNPEKIYTHSNWNNIFS